MDGERGSQRYVAVHGDAVLIALLELSIFGFFLAQPMGGVLSWAAHTGMGVSGAALLWSLVYRRTDVELAARVILVAANLLDFVNRLTAPGVHPFPLRNAIIQVIVIVAVSLRMVALARGATVVIWPCPWRRRGDG